MDRHIFSDAVVISNNHFALDVGRVREILWGRTQNRAVTDGVIVAKSDFPSKTALAWIVHPDPTFACPPMMTLGPTSMSSDNCAVGEMIAVG